VQKGDVDAEGRCWGGAVPSARWLVRPAKSHVLSGRKNLPLLVLKAGCHLRHAGRVITPCEARRKARRTPTITVNNGGGKERKGERE
jgi:hypothetical protein